MQAHFIDQQQLYHINSFLYTNNVKENDCISPKVYQTNRTIRPKKIMKPKKIILGKPYHGKQKMSLSELKALSRQIKPTEEYDISLICKKLKDNMHRAKTRLLHQFERSQLDMVELLSQGSTSGSEDDNHSIDLLNLYPTMKTHHPLIENEVTEDQINNWLQRGGFSSSPITMATDQELADLLDFDHL